jgi:hypothetical protein
MDEEKGRYLSDEIPVSQRKRIAQLVLAATFGVVIAPAMALVPYIIRPIGEENIVIKTNILGASLPSECTLGGVNPSSRISSIRLRSIQAGQQLLLGYAEGGLGEAFTQAINMAYPETSLAMSAMLERRLTTTAGNAGEAVEPRRMTRREAEELGAAMRRLGEQNYRGPGNEDDTMLLMSRIYGASPIRTVVFNTSENSQEATWNKFSVPQDAIALRFEDDRGGQDRWMEDRSWIVQCGDGNEARFRVRFMSTGRGWALMTVGKPDDFAKAEIPEHDSNLNSRGPAENTSDLSEQKN